MSLENLVGVSLEKTTPDAATIRRLLSAAERNFKEAHLPQISKTVGAGPRTVIVLDALRKQRNVADYSGDTVPESAAAECLVRAEALLELVAGWLGKNKPELLE